MYSKRQLYAYLKNKSLHFQHTVLWNLLFLSLDYILVVLFQEVGTLNQSIKLIYFLSIQFQKKVAAQSREQRTGNDRAGFQSESGLCLLSIEPPSTAHLWEFICEMFSFLCSILKTHMSKEMSECFETYFIFRMELYSSIYVKMQSYQLKMHS